MHTIFKVPAGEVLLIERSVAATPFVLADGIEGLESFGGDPQLKEAAGLGMSRRVVAH